MVSVSAQVEDLYRQNSRMEMTELLADLLLEACVSSVLIPERLVMEHAMLIAVLHGNIATDIGNYSHGARHTHSRIATPYHVNKHAITDIIIFWL